jgi:hypothetical protein
VSKKCSAIPEVLMDKESWSLAAAVVAAVGGVIGWFWAVWRGGRQAETDRATMLRQATEHTDRELEKVRTHTSAENQKLWTEVQRVKERAEADRLVLTELKSDVHYIRGAVDRLLARHDNRGDD